MGKPTEVLARFRGHFTTDAEKDRINKDEERRDIEKCVATQTFKDILGDIDRERKSLNWTPGMTQEVAASNMIATSVYDSVMEIVEKRTRQRLTEIVNG